MLQPFQQEAGQGVVVIGFWQVKLQLPVQFKDFQITSRQPGPRLILVLQQLRLHGVFLQLVPHDLSSEIRSRHQALRTAVFVHHQQQGLAAADHRQQFRQSAGLQHAHGRL